MLVRQVTLKLKHNSAPQFIRIIDKDVPLLSKQAGFRDSVTFVAPERSEAISCTFWNTNEEAETYNNNGYAGVLKALSTVTEGTPLVQSFSLSNSTFHKVEAMRV